ncbi:SH3 domain-containing protein [Roseovarius phycicola]|uniref:SH3 domain-containing protein n=1 Tax=Roseovarius phycicola TaxID=3080976 RepID=A0ABZ2HG76_9RHOB
MLITFGFLGFAFYELSGGADYKPHANSIQARAAQPQPVNVAELAPVEKSSIEDLAQAAPAAAPAERLGITLASIQVDEALYPNQTEAKSERVTASDATLDIAEQQAIEAAEDDVRKVWPGAIELFQLQEAKRVQQTESIKALKQDEEAASYDVRFVTGNVVNMRDGPGTEFEPVGQLTQGTEVAVLNSSGNGWVMLRVMTTGQEGWMADWLVSTAN